VASGGGERNIRQVALAIIRYAWSDLPERFAVERAGAAAAGKQRSDAAYVGVGTTLVPDIFWNIAERGRLVGPVCCRPVSAVSAVFVELRAADGNVEWRGSKAVHPEALAGRSGLIGVVASGGTVIAA